MTKLTKSGLNPENFITTIDGKPVALYVLVNENGAEACITNYGARLVSLMVPDQDGKIEDVVLGFDNIDDYHQQKQNFGSIVGRYAGRIKGARFNLDGKEYHLQNYEKGSNISHGGNPGFANQVWDVVANNDSILRLRYISADGENGFPGTLTVNVTYHLSYNHALTVNYEATTDKPTVLIMRIKNTPFDFTSMKAVGTDINIYDEQMSITKGYDHAFLLKHPGKTNVAAAKVYDEKSGRMLTVYTTEPALQIYTANGLDGTLVGKKGVTYNKQSAICMETMHFSDSPNQTNFPSTVLRPGETYRSQTTFQFSDKPAQREHNLMKSILLYSGAASLTGLGIVGIVSLIK